MMIFVTVLMALMNQVCAIATVYSNSIVSCKCPVHLGGVEWNSSESVCLLLP